MNKHTKAGFTLIELMITVAIIGILAAIAYPSYTAQVTNTRRSDGQSALMSLIQAQERYFTENLSYVTDLTLLSLTDPLVSDEQFYTVAASVCASPNDNIANCVLLTATPQGTQAGNGNLTLNSLGSKNW